MAATEGQGLPARFLRRSAKRRDMAFAATAAGLMCTIRAAAAHGLLLTKKEIGKPKR